MATDGCQEAMLAAILVQDSLLSNVCARDSPGSWSQFRHLFFSSSVCFDTKWRRTSKCFIVFVSIMLGLTTNGRIGSRIGFLLWLLHES